ncbi:enoyl-CoA hydratase-related protein [Paracandidimonas soli]|uniref:enoyl-CoA hydratase-related protein n=1 Tax=Paracandidimonas soli TaxID=1917182 RepID=UPI0033421C87
MERIFEFCKVETIGHVCLLTIDRPQVRNALHPPASAELDAALDAFMMDPSLRVAVLTGSGSTFCAGNDLKHQASGGAQALPPHGFGGMTARFDAPKPVIAAVNGAAHGGGFELALACDLIIAADTATFALPEPRVGVVATAGGLLRLPRQVPLKAAMGLILTGRKLSAREAHAMGLVNEVTTPDQLRQVALAWANEIAEASPAAIRAAREIVRHGMDEPAIERVFFRQKTLPAVTSLYASKDFVEGPKAFIEKRKPSWET